MDSRLRPAVVVLTPVRDQAWILASFLDAASLWADHIFIADQQSTEDSPNIAASYG